MVICPHDKQFFLNGVIDGAAIIVRIIDHLVLLTDIILYVRGFTLGLSDVMAVNVYNGYTILLQQFNNNKLTKIVEEKIIIFYFC